MRQFALFAMIAFFVAAVAASAFTKDGSVGRGIDFLNTNDSSVFDTR